MCAMLRRNEDNNSDKDNCQNNDQISNNTTSQTNVNNQIDSNEPSCSQCHPNMVIQNAQTNNQPYLPLHNLINQHQYQVTTTSPLISSPRSFVANDVIDEEEEMIFPITDLCDENNSSNNHQDNNNNNKSCLLKRQDSDSKVTNQQQDQEQEEIAINSSPTNYTSSNSKSKPIGIVPKIVNKTNNNNNINNNNNNNSKSENNRKSSSGGSSTTPDSASVGSVCSGTEDNNEDDVIEKEEEFANESVPTTATSLSSASTSWRSSSKPNSGLGTGCGSVDSNCSTSTNHSSNNVNCKMVSSLLTNKIMAHSSSAPKSSHCHHHHHHHHHSHHHHRVLNPHISGRCTSPNSMDSECDSRHNHYHTVHGTITNASPVNYDRLFQREPIQQQQQQQQQVTTISQKQRTRSHSGGPIFSNGFTQQIRHSALISAGMAIVRPPQRRQSDTSSLDQDDCNHTSRSHRTSPNGSLSIFEAFRPRSTSDGKSYKKSSSVIAALKNNFRNRHSSSAASSSNNNNWTTSSTNQTTNVQQTSNIGQHSPPSLSPLCITNQPTSNKRNGAISAPISPNSVIDPFSVDYTYAVRAFENYCQYCSLPISPILQQQQQQFQPSRPRSRSGSASTMARVFDMFRGRSNSIATEQPQTNCQHCHHKATFNHQDSLCDRFEFEDIDENLVYVRFFKFYRCYDIIPTSAKLVVFDTQLAVKKAFYALLINGIRAAPLWDAQKHKFIGMLTITDFIYILRTFYQSKDLKMEKLEEHTLDNWRTILKDKARPLVSVEPDESLFNAIKMLLHNKVHRLPVIDRDSGNVLYILTHKRILKFLFLFYYTRLPMPSYLQKTLKELPKIGTYDNIAVANWDTPLMEALTILTEKRISALPIVDKKNKVIDVYSKFDVIHLASDKMYQNLDITVKKALEFRNQSEHVIKCQMNETLHTILERIVQAEVHRIIVVDQDDHVIGIISLSDLLNFLVLRPVQCNNNTNNEITEYPTISEIVNKTNKLETPTIRTESDILISPSTTPLVEESGEDVSSQCSHNDNDNSKNTNVDDDNKNVNEDIIIAQEQNCQLTVSSNGSSSRSSTNNRKYSQSSSTSSTSTSSSSSIANDDNNNDDTTTNTSAKTTMAIKASNAATQPTLIA